MDSTSPIILWLRRDLRLSDHPALDAACRTGRPVIPLFIRDGLVDSLGAAPKWRLGLGVGHHAQALQQAGSRLTLRSGPALEVLRALVVETGAGAVWWSRLYDRDSVARDTTVKAELKQMGLDAGSFAGHLLTEPWTVQTGQGGFYRVYSPYWRAVKDREIAELLPAPGRISAPASWPDTERLEDWVLGAGMHRGAEIVRQHVRLGEQAAQDRLDAFLDTRIGDYADLRNRPDLDATSGLSENLSLGEISAHRCWYAAVRAGEEGKAGAEHFRKELMWRDFAYHLMHHTPHILTRNWREEWDAFPWSQDADSPGFRAWMTGRTGMRFVDAGQREMYVTGRMHNRTRMIVASYLTKHLMTHWRLGLRWFENCLIDWDPASNAMGWQWAAGSGPDAAPYFRVFNPESQLEKFDPKGAYAARWIAEGQRNPPETALDYFRAVPRSWNLSAGSVYPRAVIGAAEGRQRALEAYENRGF